ncbi:MAG: copper resistance protein B [Phycisphaerales bacterium]|nr:copper resistance protein B [Phycisphaerales bacterium]
MNNHPFIAALLFISPIANAQHQSDQHAEQATENRASPYEDPPLIEGTSISDALRAAAAAPPDSWPEPIGDNPTLIFTFFEQLEFRSSDDQPDQFAWDAQGWIGNDDHKFWWKSEGAAAPDGPNDGDMEFQALYAKPISPFWFLQAGLRYENTWGPGDSKDRTSLVLGLQGLSPYKFELEPVLFLTEDGDLLGRLTASYDLYITQRIVLQPRSEINLAASNVSEWGTAEGFNDLSLELRLRYEIRREFAPYIGLSYLTLLGETANIAESGGSNTDDLQLVFGIRLAF